MPVIKKSAITIVMIETSHPGNIGSAARAMKTMGLSELRLVRPQRFNSPETRALASGADDILDNAQHYENLMAAVADCHYVIGSSARSERSLPWPQLDARQCGTFIAQQTQTNTQKVALLFGRERSGLSNEELEHCHYLAHIPMAFDFFSLNIAAAIQVFCYEIMMANNIQSKTRLPEPLANNEDHVHNHQNHDNDVGSEDIAPQNQLEGFYQHLEETLIDSRYLKPDNPRLLMRRLRRLFARAQLRCNEVSMLRGMLASFQGRKFQKRGSSE